MRLSRPHIPVEVRVRVVLRQLGELWPDGWIAARRSVGQSYGNMLRNLLERLAVLLGCEVADLRLDHDPALALRKKLYETPNGGHRWTFEIEKEGKVVRYEPDANDPEHLRYRPHGAQFEGSHHVKTQIRGDGAQHPDRVLIKKMRRSKKRKKKLVSRRGRPRSTGFRFSSNKSKLKRKWPSRPMKSANRWPKRSKR